MRKCNYNELFLESITDFFFFDKLHNISYFNLIFLGLIRMVKIYLNDALEISYLIFRHWMKLK